jgi:hypothetical protein
LLLGLLGPTSCLRLSDLPPGLGFGSASALGFLICLAFGLDFGLPGLTPCLGLGRSASLGLFGGPATSFLPGGAHCFRFGGASFLQLGRLSALFLSCCSAFSRFFFPPLVRSRPFRIGFRLPARGGRCPLRANLLDFFGGLSRFLRRPAAEGLREVERRSAGRSRRSTDAGKRIASGIARRSRNRPRDTRGLHTRRGGDGLGDEGNDGGRR